jgi:hypothetical protein
MRILVGVVLFALTSCSSTPIPSAGRSYRLKVSRDAEVAEFVDAHASEEIDTLELNLHKKETSLVPLARLKGLKVLTLMGFEIPDPLLHFDGKPQFKEGLRDIQVMAIAQIRSLQRLDLWYGRLSEVQRTYLKEELPVCQIRENLNKL